MTLLCVFGMHQHGSENDIALTQWINYGSLRTMLSVYVGQTYHIKLMKGKPLRKHSLQCKKQPRFY